MALLPRPMRHSDRSAVAELIFHSTNHWYQAHARPAIFPSAAAADVFFDTYHRLDPDCGLVVEDPATGKLLGSCFYHPRPTHVSLGIMNSHPEAAGKGVARALLSAIVQFAESRRLPVRLVSSAINLDSYSLYNRAGFVPRMVFQDMLLPVPAGGFPHTVEGVNRVRPATAADLPAIAALDARLLGLRRDADYAFFLANQQGFWTLRVAASATGELLGWMASSAHPGCTMVGPGVAEDESVALALLAAHLQTLAGKSPVILVPATATRISSALYAWGAKNCELHLQQVRGESPPVRGIHMPTFLPESA